MNVLTIFIHVPYSDKNEARALGAKWNPSKKMWYCYEHDYDKFKKWHKKKEKIYIVCDYDEREHARNLGARWDKNKKSWYGYENNVELFSEFCKK